MNIPKNWALLTQFGAYTAAIASSFLLQPAIADPKHDGGLVYFNTFAATVCVATTFLIFKKCYKPSYLLRYLRFTVLVFVTTIVLFSSYSILKNKWTVDYNKMPYVISDVTNIAPDKIQFLHKAGIIRIDNSKPVLESILAKGDSSYDFWQPLEIDHRKYFLNAMYFLITISTSAIIALLFLLLKK